MDNQLSSVGAHFPSPNKIITRDVKKWKTFTSLRKANGGVMLI